MATELTCSCGNKFTVPDEYAFGINHCPKCRQVVSPPAAKKYTPPPPPAPPAAGAPGFGSPAPGSAPAPSYGAGFVHREPFAAAQTDDSPPLWKRAIGFVLIFVILAAGAIFWFYPGGFGGLFSGSGTEEGLRARLDALEARMALGDFGALVDFTEPLGLSEERLEEERSTADSMANAYMGFGQAKVESIDLFIDSCDGKTAAVTCKSYFKSGSESIPSTGKLDWVYTRGDWYIDYPKAGAGK